LLLYPEGTRFTPKNLETSQKFATEKGLPVLKYHLTPRTKGFTASIPHMRDKTVAIYDIQIAFKPSDPVKPTMRNLLWGKPLEGHMYAKRIPIEEVPEGDEAAAEWLQKLYQQKVALSVYISCIQWKSLYYFGRSIIASNEKVRIILVEV